MGWEQLSRRLTGTPQELASMDVPSKKRRTFDDSCLYLQLWLRRHDGAFPLGSSESPEERRLALWLYSVRQKHLNGRLTDTELSRLQRIAGVADRLADWERCSRRLNAQTKDAPPT